MNSSGDCQAAQSKTRRWWEIIVGEEARPLGPRKGRRKEEPKSSKKLECREGENTNNGDLKTTGGLGGKER